MISAEMRNANVNLKSNYHHTDDFSYLYWYGREYYFNKRQSRIVRHLIADHEAGGDGLNAKGLASSLGINDLSQAFRHNEAWGDVIVTQDEGDWVSVRLRTPKMDSPFKRAEGW